MDYAAFSGGPAGINIRRLGRLKRAPQGIIQRPQIAAAAPVPPPHEPHGDVGFRQQQKHDARAHSPAVPL